MTDLGNRPEHYANSLPDRDLGCSDDVTGGTARDELRPVDGALRTPDPDIWCHSADPFGPDNSEYVISLAETAGYIVAAWGAHPAAVIAGEAYLKAFRELDIPVLCLGVTKAGHPRHPLYVRGDQPLISLREATNG